MTARTRWTSALVAAAVPAAIVLGTALAWRDRLPGRLATHWSGSPGGPPDGYSRTGPAVLRLVGSCVLLWAGGAAATAVRRRSPAGAGPARAAIVLTAAAAGLLAGSWLAVATANLAAGDPAGARLGSRLPWLSLAAWAVVPLLLLRGTVPRPAGPAPRPDPLPLGAGQRAAWTQDLRARAVAGVLTAALAVTVVVALAVNPWWWAAAVTPVAVSLLVLPRVRVTVDRRGVRLVSGIVPVPLKRIPLARLAGARAEEVDPVRWGGWGYRVAPGRSALVLRAGPGLVLDLVDGRRFAVTVDDPETPARLLAGLLARDDDA